MIAGRYEGTAPRSARIRGRTGGEQVEILAAASELSEAAQPLARRALPKVWSRMKLAEIGERAVWDTENTAILAEDAKRTALSHALLSPFTAFLAVDSSRRTEGDHGTPSRCPCRCPRVCATRRRWGKKAGADGEGSAIAPRDQPSMPRRRTTPLPLTTWPMTWTVSPSLVSCSAMESAKAGLTIRQ